MYASTQYNKVLEDRSNVLSFIRILNSKGSSTEPWGAEEKVTGKLMSSMYRSIGGLLTIFSQFPDFGFSI